ncbi:hypothetical protein GGF46_000545 [Coemansia sp. RSA 552]|nr:hypothetical protein GGF46_000545 [Coemansia sp. RSA 552]
MPNPLTVITQQAKKGTLTEVEQEALRTASRRATIYQGVGCVAGACLGFYLSRRNKSWPMRGAMIFFTGAFVGGAAKNYTVFTSIKELSDKTRYPHIAASMRDITSEIMRSRGVDPQHPERGRTGTVPHTPDFKHLPPSMSSTERQDAGHVDGSYDDVGTAPDNKQRQVEFGNPGLEQGQREAQIEFGNPALERAESQGQRYDFGTQDQATDQQQQQRQQDSLSDYAGSSGQNSWDNIRRSGGSQENPWDRLRRQTTQNQQQQQQQPGGAYNQFDNAWNKLNQSEGFGSDKGSFAGDSGFGSGVESEDFDRFREDFQSGSQNNSPQGYDSRGSSGSGAFST